MTEAQAAEVIWCLKFMGGCMIWLIIAVFTDAFVKAGNK